MAELKPGEWYPWEMFIPPRDIGPILCKRNEERFTVDPRTVRPEWNIFGVYWQMPRMLEER
jgi:hypothetical protein